MNGRDHVLQVKKHEKNVKRINAEGFTDEESAQIAKHEE